MFTIDDKNWQDHLVNPSHGGKFHGLKLRYGATFEPQRVYTLEEAGIEVYDLPTIKERLAEEAANGSSIESLINSYNIPPEDQNGFGQCWLYGPCQAFAVTSLIEGEGYRFPSPNALAYMIGAGGWGNGGGDPTDSTNGLINTGGVRRELWPSDASGQTTRYNTAAAKADCDNNKLTVVIQLSDDPQTMLLQSASCYLQKKVTIDTYDWWNHVVLGVGAGWISGELQRRIRNQWGDWGEKGFGWLAGSKKYSSPTWVVCRVTASTR